MANVNVYLLFDGNCEEAFTFYKSVFNTGFSMLSRFNEVPSTEGQPSVPEQDAEKILHVSLPIGDSVLMGSDGGSNWSQYHKQGNNFSVSVNVEKREEEFGHGAGGRVPAGGSVPGGQHQSYNFV